LVVGALGCGTSPSATVAGGDGGSTGDASVANGPDGAVATPNDASSGSDGATADAAAPTDASTDSPATFGDAEAGVTVSMEVTQYGWDDNSPPGNAIAYPASAGYPTLHDAAGGTGTYADPITFASDKDEYPPGTILYVPFLEKYVIMEDDCGGCNTDWTTSMKRHIDVWMNSNGTETASALFACEDTWTMSATNVVESPPPNLLVTTPPLFDPSTNTCRTTP
jgi:3D (Asp-Asp-Asp) domain-containing protein